MIRGGAASARNEILHNVEPGRGALRRGDWKLVKDFRWGKAELFNLKADPYEKAIHESEMGYMRWYVDNMWLFVPVQMKLMEFFKSLEGYPFQEGSSLSASGINYRSLKAYKAMKVLEEIQKTGRGGMGR